MTHMPRRLWIDTETYCETPISHGTFAYAEQAEIILFSYALDNGEVYLWDRTNNPTIPENLKGWLENVEEVWAHNMMFDRTVIYNDLNILIPIHKSRCMMARALVHSLPGSLDRLCDLFNTGRDLGKDKEGRTAMQLFCKPRSQGSRATPAQFPDRWKAFCKYAKQDIVAMRHLDKLIPRWNWTDKEIAIWQLDQRINNTGVKVDMSTVSYILRGLEDEKGRLAEKTKLATKHAVESATQRDRLLEYLNEVYQLGIPDLRASTIESVINSGELEPEVLDILSTRLQATTTSTAKYRALSSAVSYDNRLRGTLQYSGASRTRRWAGRIFQPQNLPRQKMTAEEIDIAIKAINTGTTDLLYDNYMGLAKELIRSMITAEKGNKLIVGDLANIEGRILAWVAEENWKVKAYRDFDKGVGSDLYKLAYARAFNKPVEEVTKDDRQVGKVMELALGYQGGVGAFNTFARAYGINLDTLKIPPEKFNPSSWVWAEENQKTYDLTRDTYLSCDAVKTMWREAHPKIKRFWDGVNTGVRAVLLKEAERVKVGRVEIDMVKNWMRIKLPSGAYLSYPMARISPSGSISYRGLNQFSRKWETLNTYGGKLTENIVQSIARDVIAEAMLRIQQAGYNVIMSVHDEIVVEAGHDVCTAEDIEKLLVQVPDWAEGLPLAAGVFETIRYRKE